MDRAFMKFQALHKSINLWVFLAFFVGCSQTPTPPEILSGKPADNVKEKASGNSDPLFFIPEPCKGIKIVGELTPFEFAKLFDCLNQKGVFKELNPLVRDNPDNTALFTKLYNENFGANPRARKETLDIIHR